MRRINVCLSNGWPSQWPGMHIQSEIFDWDKLFQPVPSRLSSWGFMIVDGGLKVIIACMSVLFNSSFLRLSLSRLLSLIDYCRVWTAMLRTLEAPHPSQIHRLPWHWLSSLLAAFVVWCIESRLFWPSNSTLCLALRRSSIEVSELRFAVMMLVHYVVLFTLCLFALIWFLFSFWLWPHAIPIALVALWLNVKSISFCRVACRSQMSRHIAEKQWIGPHDARPDFFKCTTMYSLQTKQWLKKGGKWRWPVLLQLVLT